MLQSELGGGHSAKQLAELDIRLRLQSELGGCHSAKQLTELDIRLVLQSGPGGVHSAQQLAELDEWSSLTPHERTVLIFTALLHDAAKPLTSQTDPETGRISSPKHAVKGEHVARGVLRDLGCDLSTREQIARLVRYHGRPAFLLERSEPTHEVVRLSWLVNNRLLYLFALADTRGRDTDSMSRPEENLHYWKLLAEENDCYDQPYDFSNNHARFMFFRQREPNLYYVPHEDFLQRNDAVRFTRKRQGHVARKKST